MHGGLKVIATVALALGMAAPAHASAPYAIWDVDPSGDPSLVAAEFGAIVTLSECADGGSTCTVLPDQDASDGYAHATAGETAAGTVFEATFAYAGQPAVTWRSPAWDGRFAVTSPPTLTGSPVVGGSVVPQSGTAAGGWHGAPAISVAGVVACTQPTSDDCWTLAYSGASGPIDARWAGYSLAAVEFWDSVSIQGNPPVPPVPAPAPVPWGPHPWDRSTYFSGPIHSHSTFTGPVAVPISVGVTHPAAPTAAIRTRAQRAKGHLRVARVTCATTCTVRLTVSGGGKTIRRSLAVKGARSLTIAPRHGRLKVRVVVDGKTLASGFSRAR